jgi:hypothetical protein
MFLDVIFHYMRLVRAFFLGSLYHFFYAPQQVKQSPPSPKIPYEYKYDAAFSSMLESTVQDNPVEILTWSENKRTIFPEYHAPHHTSSITYVMDYTPVGNVVLRYSPRFECFEYYSDREVPYRFLESLAKRWAMVTGKISMVVDMETELKAAREKALKARQEKKIVDLARGKHLKGLRKDDDKYKEQVFRAKSILAGVKMRSNRYRRHGRISDLWTVPSTQRREQTSMADDDPTLLQRIRNVPRNGRNKPHMMNMQRFIQLQRAKQQKEKGKKEQEEEREKEEREKEERTGDVL